MAANTQSLTSGFGQQAAPGANYEHECDACKFEGTISEGISFCNVCGEFLCDECKRVHRKSRATRDHELVDGGSLLNVQRQEPTQAFDFCLKHPGKLANFFCPMHDNVFCTDCRVISHGGCREVKGVSAASTTIHHSEEAEKFAERIRFMNARITSLCDERNRCLVQLDNDKQRLLQEITDIRGGINTLLDKLEKGMRETVLSTVTNETNKVQNDISALNTFKSSLEGDRKNVDAAKTTGNNEKFFLAMKRTSLQELKAPLDVKETFLIKIDFKPHHLLQEILSSLQSFGNLETTYIKHPPNMFPVSLRDQALVQDKIQNMQRPDDAEPCSITGSVYLPSGEGLLCDFANSRVKLVNAGLTLHTGDKLSNRPWDVAMVTEKEVIVSLPNERKLQYVTVQGNKPGLRPDRKLKIGRPCWGLAAHKDRIFVTCHDNPGNGEILVLNNSGAIQRRIGRTGDRSYMFTSPDYIAVDALGEKMYVSDRFQHSVTCLTREGGPVYHCVLGDAVYPYSLLVDSEGGVLVCSKDSSTTSLQFLTPEGNHYRTLITWSRERWLPVSFCYRSMDRSLLVGMYENNQLLVRRFE